jgi:hypothetical protein
MWIRLSEQELAKAGQRDRRYYDLGGRPAILASLCQIRSAPNIQRQTLAAMWHLFVVYDVNFALLMPSMDLFGRAARALDRGEFLILRRLRAR